VFLLVTFDPRQAEWSLGILAVALMRIKSGGAAHARHAGMACSRPSGVARRAPIL
jgi:hypothetical protein